VGPERQAIVADIARTAAMLLLAAVLILVILPALLVAMAA
jgi:hypothetical protein